MKQTSLSIGILAGGASLRMGQDKARLPFLGQPIVQRVVERLSPLGDEIFILSNDLSLQALVHLPILPDSRPNLGPLGGLLTALEAARFPFLALGACDMPFINPALYAYQLQLLEESGADVVLPASPQGLEPTHAVFRRGTCLPVVRQAMDHGQKRMVGWFDQVHVNIIPPQVVERWEPNFLAFLNLNTPEEYAAALEWAQRSAPGA